MGCGSNYFHRNTTFCCAAEVDDVGESGYIIKIAVYLENKNRHIHSWEKHVMIIIHKKPVV